VGLYFLLGKKCAPDFLVEESGWMVDLGKWTQVKWNRVKRILREYHSQEYEKVELMSWQY
jgi:hypothetical protein